MSATFPILKTDELVACLNELGFDLEQRDLKEPQSGYIRGLYESMVDLLMGVKKEDIQTQPDFGGMIEAFEYPELHTDALPRIMMDQLIIRLFQSSGIEDFSLKDMWKPTKDRTRRNLSALVNFAKFREEKLENYTQLVEKSDILTEESAALATVNEELTMKLMDIKSQQAHDKEGIAEEQQIVDGLRQEINELNNEQLALSEQARQLKDSATESMDQTEKHNFEIHQVQLETATMRGQVVQSPERMKQDVDSLSVALRKEQERISQSERLRRELTGKLNALDGSADDLSKCQRFLVDIEAEFKKEKSALQKIENMKEQIDTNKKKQKEHEETKKQLTMQTSSKLEQLSRIESQQKEQSDALDTKMQQVRQEMENINAFRKNSETKMTQNAALVASIKDNMKAMEANHIAEMAQLDQSCAGLQTQIENYHSSILRAINQ